jgi:plasmid maintenance system antidote protein VapI
LTLYVLRATPAGEDFENVENDSSEFWLNLQSNYEIAMLDYTGERDRICSETRQLA